MTIDAHLEQHGPFDSTEPPRPWWLPAEDLPGPDWHLYRSGDFPVVQDKALIEAEVPDA